MWTFELWERDLRRDDVRMLLPRAHAGIRSVIDGLGLKTEGCQRDGVQLTRVVVTVDEEDKGSRGWLPWAAAFHGVFPRSDEGTVLMTAS
jgi:hypothetical protein